MTFNRFRPAKRGRRVYFISLCAIVIVLFTVAHWQSYKILVNETRDKFITGLAKNNSDERIVDRFQGVIRTGNPVSNVITDAICSSKGFLHSGCHKGICMIGSDDIRELCLNQSEAAYFPALQLSDEDILGVPKSDIYKYQPNEARQFVCLDSGEEVTWSAVNDDYCDCVDGTDEPGTSACPDTRFYCLPEGKYIPASRVNDGICDCCDGSDEWKRLIVGGDVLTHHNIDITYSPCKDACVKKGTRNMK